MGGCLVREFLLRVVSISLDIADGIDLGDGLLELAIILGLSYIRLGSEGPIVTGTHLLRFPDVI